MKNKQTITVYITIKPIQKKRIIKTKRHNRYYQEELPLFSKPKGRPKSDVTVLDLKRILENRNESRVSVSNVDEIAELFGVSTRTLHTIWKEYKQRFAQYNNSISN